MRSTLVFLFTLSYALSNAQSDNNIQQSLSVNTSGSNAHSSAILDVSSTTKGAVFPRMTTAQKSALSGIATEGLVVYDTDLKQYCYWEGTAWKCFLQEDNCETLDDAYDCGGPGNGKTVFVTDGSVTFDGTYAPGTDPTVLATNGGGGNALNALGFTGHGVYGESTGLDGVYGKSLVTDDCDVAGVTGEGGGDRASASAIEARNGAIAVSKTSSASLPADVFSVLISSWTPFETCFEMPSCPDCMDHTHQHGRFSGIITIPNDYADMSKSVILLTIEGREGLSVQLDGIGDGSFTVRVFDMAAQLFCNDQSGGLSVNIHYLIINRV